MKDNEGTEQSSVKKRLLIFLKYKNLSQSEFEKICNLSNGYVNNIRKSIKSEKFDENIAPNFPELNKYWLLFSEGDMITEENSVLREPITSYNSELMLPKDGAKPGIPYYNVDFAGGWSSDEMFADVRPDFYINNPEFDRSDFACNLIGKSVSKIIPDGAVVGFKVIEDWQTYFPQNELYGIITKNDFRTVKLIAKSKDGKFLILKPQPSNEFAERYKDQEEKIPIDFVDKFLQVIAYACYERISM